MSTIIIISRPPPPPPGDANKTAGELWRDRYADYCLALAAINAAFARGDTITVQPDAPVDP